MNPGAESSILNELYRDLQCEETTTDKITYSDSDINRFEFNESTDGVITLVLSENEVTKEVDCDQLKKILTDWSLEFFYDKFVESQIEMDKNFMKTCAEDWNACLLRWDRTFACRSKYIASEQESSISSILQAWPLFRHNLGHTLIDRDFTQKYGEEISMSLINKWPVLINSFKPVHNKIKDKIGQELLKLLSSNSEEACRDVITALLLHVILKPVRRLQIKTQEGKSYWKPGIKASQDSFFTIVTNHADVLKTTEERAKFYKDLGLSCQPYIIGVGSSVCPFYF